MNSYTFYPGDYLRDTQHLTLLEHGVYRLLLDFYYSTGKPLPANAKQLQSICRAHKKAEIRAIDSILTQFFVKKEDGHHNSKADSLLAKSLDIRDKRREAAMQMHSKCSAKAPSPIPLPLKEKNISILRDVSKKKKVESCLSPDFQPDAGSREYAGQLGLDQMEIEYQAERFVSYYTEHPTGKKKKYTLWQRCFKEWLTSPNFKAMPEHVRQARKAAKDKTREERLVAEAKERMKDYKAPSGGGGLPKGLL